MIRITTNARRPLAQLTGIARQLPFAAATAVNTVTLAAQKAKRDEWRRDFTLRRADFVEKQGAKVQQFATKARPAAILGPDRKADFLAKFEAGGEKRPTQGHSIAIPVGVRRNKRDIVTKGNRPRALLASKRAQTVDGQEGRIFIVRLGERRVHAGKVLAPGVYQRIGGSRNPRLKLLYLLKPKTRVDARLQLERTTRRVVAREWGPAYTAAIEKAVATARR